VLGDDIVIANGPVAREYRRLMDQLGVEIGLAKSLVSRNRTLEFAKRFFIPADASPVSLLELAVATKWVPAMVEYAAKHALTHAQVLSLVGFGYRVKARIQADFHVQSGRVSTLLMSLVRGKVLTWEWITRRSLSPLRVFLIEDSQRRAMLVSSLSAYITQSLKSRYDSIARQIVLMSKWANLLPNSEVQERRGKYSKEFYDRVKPDQMDSLVRLLLTVLLAPKAFESSVYLERVRLWWSELSE